MDLDQVTAKPSGVPRLSRLPRATPGPAIGNNNGTSSVSRLPRAAHAISVKVQSVQEGGATHTGAGTRFGWHQSSGRTSRPSDVTTRESAAAEEINSEHDTGRVTENANRNGEYRRQCDAPLSIGEAPAEQRKKKPRPSLSERTMETMSQVPPSPSPSKRKSSITDGAPSIPMAQSPHPSILRSPQTQFAKPALFSSPSKSLASSRNVQVGATEPTAAKTPYKSRVSNFGVNTISSPNVGTKAVPTDINNNVKPGGVHRVQKIRSLLDLKDVMNKQPLRKASLNFNDVSTHRTESRETARKIAGDTTPKSPLQTDRKPSQLRKRSSFFTPKPADTGSALEASGSPGPKSSASLREAIAKAKAAKNKALVATGMTASHSAVDERFLGSLSEQESSSGIFPGSLNSRIGTAVTSGSLNIAALGLKSVPLEILSMYDSKEQGHQGWSEAIDLTKLIIADNEIDSIPDDVFPDWTMEELQDDDNKANILGGLEVLDFHGNQISHLPIGLRRLERLRVLNISNNNLTFAALEVICQMINLKELSLAHNALEGVLPSLICQLQQLHTLNLQNNKMTDISTALANLGSLRKLDISNNLVSNLPMNELAHMSLIDFKAAGNKLSGVLFPATFSGLSALQSLNVSNNNLSIIFEGSTEMPQLQTVVVDNNKLQSIGELSGFQALVTLTASANQLEDIPEGFVTLHSLRAANFSGNNIKILDPYISRMENLSIFNLEGNPLRDRKYLTMSTADLKTELAKRLTAVYVRDDEMKTPTAGLETPEKPSGQSYKAEKGVLDLSTSNFGIADIDLIDLTSRVHAVNISHNQLFTFPERFLNRDVVQGNLKVLDISFSKTLDAATYLTSIISLSNLSKLSIANSGITSIDPLTTFLVAPQLTDLNISCNRLRGPIPSLKQHFVQLVNLIASDNEFTSITPDAIRGLEVVDVRNNEIEFLPPKIGELGNVSDRREPGRLRTFECGGNKFRVPRIGVVEKGTEAILKDLRRMVITDELGEEWRA